MGQYWMLVNLDKRITTEHSCFSKKLWEIYTNGTKCDIIERLIVPTKPISNNKYNVPPSEWAGDRLICIGDYIKDYPPNVFTESEMKKIQAYESLYAWAYKRFKDPSNYGSYPLDEVYPLDRSWVLRNLSKKLFVQLDEVDEDECGSLEQILLCYICWCSDPSSAMNYSDLTRGEWAGDRFDITVIENVMDADAEEGDGPWVDVTEEVVAKVRLVYATEGRGFN